MGSNKDLLAQKYDLVMFTGSPKTGREVLKAASNFMTPCILELGGKSPAIIDKDANFNTVMQIIV